MDNSFLKLYKITSDSMYPLLQGGDFFLAAKIKSAKDLSIGQCLIYDAGRTNPVCHRLIKIKEKNLYLKGDCSLALDSPISCEEVLGRVVAVQKQGKLISLDTFSQKTRGRITAYISLLSIRFHFLMRVMRLLYYPLPEIIQRLGRKFTICSRP